MEIEAYDPSHLEAILRLSIRAMARTGLRAPAPSQVQEAVAGGGGRRCSGGGGIDSVVYAR